MEIGGIICIIGRLESGELIASLNEITLLVKELEEIRDFGMNAAVIALANKARKAPQSVSETFSFGNGAGAAR